METIGSDGDDFVDNGEKKCENLKQGGQRQKVQSKFALAGRKKMIGIKRKRKNIGSDVAGPKAAVRKVNKEKNKKVTNIKKAIVDKSTRRGRKVVGKVSESDTESSGDDNMLHASIRTRSSPTPLFAALHALSPDQRNCLKLMGFGKMLKFNVDRIPGKLGYYVVDQFDDQELAIKIEDGSIKITKETIHNMIGVPMEGIRLGSLDVGNLEDDIAREWFKQYKKKEITPVEIKKKIVQSDEADWNFKLNFLILFTNVMGGCKTRGTCKLGILAYIREDTIIQNIDWCRYLLACMKSCKSGWKRDDARTYFAGPIALLTLIYVEATTCDQVTVPRRRPAMRSWSYEFLKQREDAEIEDGGFGLGDVLPADETSSLDEVDLSDEEHRNKGDFYVSPPNDVKGYAFKMEMLYNRIVNDSVNLKSTLSDALEKFPDDVQIEEWHDKIVKILEKTINIGEDDGKHPKDEDLTKDIGVDTAGKSFQTPLTSKVQGLEINEDEQLSQFWRDPEVLQQVERSFEGIERRADIGNIPFMQDSSVPRFSLGLTQEFENAASEVVVLPQDTRNQKVSVIVNSKTVRKATNNISETRQTRGQRVKKASNAGRSPFFQRIVELREQITRPESNVWKYMRSQTGIFSEIMFATVDGHETIQDLIETMLPKSMISAHIIDCWAVLLNIEEGKRSNNTVARLFFHTGMMKEDMLKGTMDDEVVLDMFVANVDEVLKGDQSVMTLKGFDLVFFPIVQDAHFYLLCFNMKSGVFEVIDNMYDRIQFKEKYKGVPEKVQKVFAAYLKLVGHPKAGRIEKANPVRLEMKWRTMKNVWDCGIFVMRHMETYKGEAVSKWDCDLDVEGAKQTRRLTRLRKKYATKILLSEHNVHRDKVLNYANAYVENIKKLKLSKQNGDSLLGNNLQA